jgi:hypothetical protein
MGEETEDWLTQTNGSFWIGIVIDFGRLAIADGDSGWWYSIKVRETEVEGTQMK